MTTPKECRHNAEACLKLASGADEIYVKEALMELAAELRILAEHLERGGSASKEAKEEGDGE